MTRIGAIVSMILNLAFFSSVLIPLGLPNDAGAAEDCPYKGSDGKCYPPCIPGVPPKDQPPACIEPRVRCDGPCDYCYAIQGVYPGETGGPAGGCKNCGPLGVCIGCMKKPDCTAETPPTTPSPPADTPESYPSETDDDSSAPSAQSVRVVKDVDVYDVPGGSGQVVGVLEAGGKVSVEAWPCPDNWCNVSGSAVPGGKGWVYSGPDYQSLEP